MIPIYPVYRDYLDRYPAAFGYRDFRMEWGKYRVDITVTGYPFHYLKFHLMYP